MTNSTSGGRRRSGRPGQRSRPCAGRTGRCPPGEAAAGDLLGRTTAHGPAVGVVDIGDGVTQIGAGGVELAAQLVAHEGDGRAAEVGAHRGQPEEPLAGGDGRADLARPPPSPRSSCPRSLATRAAAAEMGLPWLPSTTVAPARRSAAMAEGTALGPGGVDRRSFTGSPSIAAVVVDPLDGEAHAPLLLVAARRLGADRGVQGADGDAIARFGAGAPGGDHDHHGEHRQQPPTVHSDHHHEVGHHVGDGGHGPASRCPRAARRTAARRRGRWAGPTSRRW